MFPEHLSIVAGPGQDGSPWMKQPCHQPVSGQLHAGSLCSLVTWESELLKFLSCFILFIKKEQRKS